MRTLVVVRTAAPWPCVHTTTRQPAKRRVYATPCSPRATGATHATQHPAEVPVLVLSIGEVEASYLQLTIGEALARGASVVTVRSVTGHVTVTHYL